MSKQIQKSLHHCLSKMKISNKRIKFRIRSRRRTKTASFAPSDKEIDAVTLSDIDQFLFENFRSLYRSEDVDGGDEGKSFESPLIIDTPPLCGSERFFVASGSANEASATPDDFIALLTHSPRPYEDFRRSMEEMVAARVGHDGEVDWEFMQELLLCYLDLNNKKSYRYILRAFVDLIVVLRENSGKPLSGGAALRKRM